MESRRDGVPIAHQRRCKNYASFSSTLLDAIYRSIDETDDGGGAGNSHHRDPGARDSISGRKKQGDGCGVNGRNPPAIPIEVPRSSREYWNRSSPCSVTRSRRDHWSAAATSSSSDVSSYGGFSSSETESVAASYPSRLRPIRTSAIGASTFPARFARSRASAALPSPPPAVSGTDDKRGKKDRDGSIGSRLLRELRKGRGAGSPGARLANFLNSLFSAKPKVPGDAVGSSEESACSTGSSYARSCLMSKMSSSSREKQKLGKRTVRFSPTCTIDACDPPPVRDPDTVKRAMELLRISRMEEDREEGESDSSSDLFELENLTAAGRFHDELPVYETTNIAIYRGTGTSHGLLV